MLLIVSVGSIYAADDLMESENNLDIDDDFELDDDSDLDDEFDDDWDYEDWDDIDFDFDDEDFEDLNFTFFNYDFLKYKIISYLEYNGNSSDVNWTESEDFYAQYQIYLDNPENYTLNQSSENYEIALKIYNSITSSFEHFNLTDNETEYLKFLIIYYLNNYGGNLSEYEDYYSEYFYIMAKASCLDYNKVLNRFYSKNLNNVNSLKTSIPSVDVDSGVVGNETNSTGIGNLTVTGGVEKETNNSLMFILMLIVMLLFIIVI